MGLEDLFNAISLGTSLARRAVELKKQIDSLNSGPADDYQRPGDLVPPERRIADLELLGRNQAARITALELGLQDASAVSESLARRLSAIFWIAVSTAGVALLAAALSIVALLRVR
jgi:hypothetical protein